MQSNYDEIEYPRMARGKTYKEYLAENKLKGYGKNGMPIFSEEERQAVDGAGTDTFTGGGKKK